MAKRINKRTVIRTIVETGSTKKIDTAIRQAKKAFEKAKKSKTKAKYARRVKKLTINRLEGLLAKAIKENNPAAAYEYANKIDELQVKGFKTRRKLKTGESKLAYKLTQAQKTDLETAAEMYGWWDMYPEIAAIKNQGERQQRLIQQLIADEIIIRSKDGNIYIIKGKEEYIPA